MSGSELEALAELATRVETLAGPCRKTDAEIAMLCDRPAPEDPDRNLAIFEKIVARVRAGGDDCEIAAYTGSLDAVRSLIDPSDEWELKTLYNIARASVGINRDQQSSWTGYGEHPGCDPVLAFLAAALRARARQATSAEQSK